MKIQRRSAWLYSIVILPVVTLLCSASVALAEVEPNNACSTANDYRVVTLPFYTGGSLLQSDTGDVDFFSFQVEADSVIEVKLQGSNSENGTLGDPFLGFFDSDCNIVDSNDDYLGNDSRLVIRVLGGDRFVLAATGGTDAGFTGAHPHDGTYLLTLRAFAALGSISGRIVVADTGMPLPTYVSLYACENETDPETCDYHVANAYAYEGAYSFTQDDDGESLAAGAYLVHAYYYAGVGDYYYEVRSDVFSVSEEEHYDVGVLKIDLREDIGSISGHLIDAVTGDPLSGADYPYADLYLEVCEDWCRTVGWAIPDAEGSFRFAPEVPGSLPAGNYVMHAHADDYEDSSTEVRVDEGEDLDVGDIPLTPFPIKVAVAPCDDLPARGGTCRFSATVTNRSGGKVVGRVWSVVTTSTDNKGEIVFQTDPTRMMNLSSGESRKLRFDYYVPRTVPDGTLIFVSTLFSEGTRIEGGYFNLLDDDLFCVSKRSDEGFSTLSKKETREIFRGKHPYTHRLPRPKR